MRAADALAPAARQDMLIEAAKGAVILAILERLFLTRHAHWVRQPLKRKLASLAPPLTLPRARQLEEHIDFLAVQALLWKQTSLGFAGQIRVFVRNTRRLAE
jgi:hypothetical protein